MRCVKLKNSKSPRRKLYCFHHAGGSALNYKNWRQEFSYSADIDINAIELPNRIFPFESDTEFSFKDLIDEVGDFISHDAAASPFGLFGQSMGGLLAHEIAKSLESKGMSGLHWLGISSYMPTYLMTSNAKKRWKHTCSDEELIQYLITLDDEGGRLFLDKEFRKLYLPVFRRDLELMESYVPDSRDTEISVPISVFVGNNDPTINFNEICLWRYRTRSTFKTFIYEGGHNLLSENESRLRNDVCREFTEACETLLIR